MGCTLDAAEAIKIMEQSKVLLGLSGPEATGNSDPVKEDPDRDAEKPKEETKPEGPRRIGGRGGPLSIMELR